MAKYSKGQPECTPYSLEKKPLPGGSPEGVKLSARKVLGSINGGSDRPMHFNASQVLGKA